MYIIMIHVHVRRYTLWGTPACNIYRVQITQNSELISGTHTMKAAL